MELRPHSARLSHQHTRRLTVPPLSRWCLVIREVCVCVRVRECACVCVRERELGWCFIDWRGLAHANTPFPCPASQLLSTAVFAALTPPLTPYHLLLLLLNPTLLSLCASPLRRSHIQRFFPPPPPSPHWIWVRGSGSDSTSQNHPPDPTLPPPSFVAVEAWACQWTVYVWWPAAGLSNMT